MKRCFCCYFITFHFLIACVDKDDTSINLTIENEISKYDDDTYVNLVVDIKCFDQRYYIVDGEYNSLYILDDDFELIESIGNSGRGPEEFISMCNVLVDKNGFYLSDYRGNFILKYNHSIKDKAPERRINLPDNIRLGVGDFHYENGVFYFHSRVNQDFWIVKYDLDRNITSYFGKREDPNFKEQLSIVKGSNDVLLGIPRYSEKIYMFATEDAKLVNEFDINLPKKSMIKWKELKRKGKNPPLFTDSYFFKNELYIIFQDFYQSTRGLLIIDFDDYKNISNVQIKYLKSKNGDDVFAVKNDKIITFSMANRSIQLYKN